MRLGAGVGKRRSRLRVAVRCRVVPSSGRSGAVVTRRRDLRRRCGGVGSGPRWGVGIAGGAVSADHRVLPRPNAPVSTRGSWLVTPPAHYPFSRRGTACGMGLVVIRIGAPNGRPDRDRVMPGSGRRRPVDWRPARKRVGEHAVDPPQASRRRSTRSGGPGRRMASPSPSQLRTTHRLRCCGSATAGWPDWSWGQPSARGRAGSGPTSVGGIKLDPTGTVIMDPGQQNSPTADAPRLGIATAGGTACATREA